VVYPVYERIRPQKKKPPLNVIRTKKSLVSELWTSESRGGLPEVWESSYMRRARPGANIYDKFPHRRRARVRPYMGSRPMRRSSAVYRLDRGPDLVIRWPHITEHSLASLSYAISVSFYLIWCGFYA